MARFVEQVANVVTIARGQAAVQPTGRGQAQTRAGTAERYAFIGNYAEVANTGDGVAQRGGVQRSVGLDILVATANQL